MGLSGLLTQARFTEALLRDKAGIDFAPERIYSQTVSGQPKSEVLVQLHARHPGCSYHFIEDKFGTLDKVREAAATLEMPDRPPCRAMRSLLNLLL